MSKSQILSELPQLSAADRAEILAALCALEVDQEPSAEERDLLRNERAAYEADQDDGSPLEEVLQRLRSVS